MNFHNLREANLTIQDRRSRLVWDHLLAADYNFCIVGFSSAIPPDAPLPPPLPIPANLDTRDTFAISEVFRILGRMRLDAVKAKITNRHAARKAYDVWYSQAPSCLKIDSPDFEDNLPPVKAMANLLAITYL